MRDTAYWERVSAWLDSLELARQQEARWEAEGYDALVPLPAPKAAVPQEPVVVPPAVPEAAVPQEPVVVPPAVPEAADDWQRDYLIENPDHYL